MISSRSLVKRLLSSLGGTASPQTVQEVDVPPLTDDVQLMVATESALVAAVELILLQREAWNELVEGLEESGMGVQISPQAAERFEMLMARLNAAMKVTGEVIGIDEQTMKELFHD